MGCQFSLMRWCSCSAILVINSSSVYCHLDGRVLASWYSALLSIENLWSTEYADDKQFGKSLSEYLSSFCLRAAVSGLLSKWLLSEWLQSEKLLLVELLPEWVLSVWLLSEWVLLNCVTPLVLQVYFRNHSGSLDNPNIDTQSQIMSSHPDFPIGSTFRICSPIGKISITLPSYQLINNSNQAERR